jgi:hypothetical protein
MYELRLYHAVPGRLDELVERIGRVLPPFFDRHGFPPRLGQWTVSAGPALPMFVWLLRWPGGFDERTAAFAALSSDQEWQSVRQRTNGTGEMVRKYDFRFLLPSPTWSPLTDPHGSPSEPMSEEIFEFREHSVPVGALGATTEALAETCLPALADDGAKVLGVFDNQSGPSTPGVSILLAWNTYAERRDSLRRCASTFGGTRGGALDVLGPASCMLLEATPHGRPNHGLCPNDGATRTL